MPRLDTIELEHLSKHVQDAISSTPYACSSLEPLNGGTTSFVFRGVLVEPIAGDAAPHQRTVNTIIVKHAASFSSCNREFAVSDIRASIESVMMHALQKLVGPPARPGVEVATPRTHHFDEKARVQVIEDFFPAVDLASLLKSTPSRDALEGTNVGIAIGSWLRNFHDWASRSRQIELRKRVAEGCRPMRDLKWQITYESVLRSLQRWPTILATHKSALKQVEGMAAMEFEKEWQGDETEADAWGIIHGDFWTGNILASASDRNPIGAETITYLCVIDWEFAQYGHRAYDLGQIIGDILETNHFTPSKILEDLVTGFVEGYGALQDTMAFRVAIQVGVHMINWCSRHAPPQGSLLLQVEKLMQEAVSFVVRGWQQDKKWFDKSLLSCLFS
ncbi:hypothetical protein CC86DRAFT_147191 [Ophiobolus disseminans]|uniref:Aminoglycoside phosphotransferase domain-containing protein n=1 Tax=Ophiobolus disseminans TaxID=1469910 RepID=A0A6A6ZEI7_9PLEO|nr:hypothetical protein CC86DRAFT_147191 [Ophiobolus disseminans]